MEPRGGASTASRSMDDGVDRQPPRRFAGLVAVGLLVVTGVWFLAVTLPRATGPFGDSHDGRNGAVWGAHSRALRELGIVASRLGALAPDGTVYTNHPPLIIIETALAETIAGEHPFVTRAPAWLAALGVIPLLYRLLLRWGMRPVPAAGGVAVAMANPMVVAYGPMLDTPMTSIVFGLTVILAWTRAWQREPWPGWATFAVALLAALAGWEATLLVGFAAASLLGREVVDRRAGRGPGDRGPMLALAGGGALGFLLVAAWAAWATGDPLALATPFRQRTSADDFATPAGALELQTVRVLQLFGPVLIGLIGCVWALRSKARRPLAGLVLAVTLTYPVVFFNGAFHHDYWNYWWVLPIGVGSAHVFDRLTADLAGSIRWADALVVGVAAAALVWAPVPDRATGEIADGQDAGRAVAAAADWPVLDREVSADVVGVYHPDDWIRYALRTGRHVRLDTPADVAALARDHPGAAVFVPGNCLDGPLGDLCRSLRAHDAPAAPPASRVVDAACLQAWLTGPRRPC